MEVVIERLDHFGRGISFVNGKICFVEKALPNEVVDIEIIKEHKKFLEAKKINILEKCNVRIEEECLYSEVCGGCQLNHMCYNEEIRFKNEKIKDILKKYADISSDKIKGLEFKDRNHYRNKITLHGNENDLGLYKESTNEIIPIQECILANDKINEIIKVLVRSNKGIKEAIIKTSNDNSKVMVDIKGKVDLTEELKTLVTC